MRDRDEESRIEDFETLRKVQQENESINAVPGGYYTITLSEKGKLGCAPAEFHMKNFTTEGMIKL